MRLRLGISVIILLAISFFAVTFGVAHASMSDNLSGWAWSSTIGWVSFNNTNNSGSSCNVGTPPICYGVNLNPTTGYLTGYAWSSNVGWISFNPSDVTAACGAQAQLVGSAFQGWARAIVAAGKESQGWDGCISMLGNVPAYGITINGQALQSYSWGDRVIGWLKYDPGFGGVFYNMSGGVNIRRVDLNGADLSGTTAALDGQVDNANPAIWSQVSNTTHYAGVAQDSRSVKAGTCTYPSGGAECTVSSYPLSLTCGAYGAWLICSVPVTVTTGNVSKVVFQYTPALGDLLVKRIQYTDTTTPDAPAGTIATVDSGNPVTSNPALYHGLSGTHAVGVNVLPGYNTLVGSCSYVMPAGGTLSASDVYPTGCTVTNFATATLVSGVPTYNTTVDSGLVKKVVFKYSAPPFIPEPACQPEDPSRSGVRISAAPVGQPVNWVSNGTTSATSTYTWKNAAGNTIASGVGLLKVSQVYSTLGSKSVSLTVDALQPVQCDLVNDQPSFKVTASPNYQEF